MSSLSRSVQNIPQTLRYTFVRHSSASAGEVMKITKEWLLNTGFSEPPAYKEAAGTETLYRVYGGGSRIIGSCYSFENPTSVSQAEFDSNIVKWGNLCLWVATFKPMKGTPMYVGRIDQSFERKSGRDVENVDDGNDVFLGGRFNAQQVWIDPKRAIAYLSLIGNPRRLKQDKTVISIMGNA